MGGYVACISGYCMQLHTHTHTHTHTRAHSGQEVKMKVCNNIIGKSVLALDEYTSACAQTTKTFIPITKQSQLTR